MIADQLPALQVALPLIAAPFCVFLRRPLPAWGWAMAVTLACLGMAISLLITVLHGEPISYHVGDWDPPWGIELRVDMLTAFVLVLVSGIGALVMAYARESVQAEIPSERHALFYAMYLLCLTGLLGMTITGDAFNLFVFLEISSLSTYAMVGLGKGRQALLAAYNYLILGTVGATFYVLGVGLLYMITGTLNMADLAERLPAVANTRTFVAAAGFLAVGLSLKLALFPLHKWLPPAYTYAPSVVTAFLASTATKVSLYVLIRIFVEVLAPAFHAAHLPGPLSEGDVITMLALAAIFSGSFVAIFQRDAKRLLAYSSVAQIGYMVLGVSMLTVTGLSAGLVHMFNHAIIKATLFLAVGCVYLRIGSVQIKDMAGMGKRMPLTMAAFVLGGLSLIGVPGTAGFVSKWQLVMGAFEKGWWWAALLIGLSSLLAVIYVWKVVEVAYFKPVPKGAPPIKEAPISMLVPLALIALCNLFFGLQTEWSLGVARAAAASLLGGGSP
ncbi:monovalent cation/H+ antiporter subunit D family protein [Rhodospirillum sp. A1_3_36]|uniref:monovalent cation/H+ antiporter subunit D family protein n=1 Tax=Rhodospirillum sp. A1_3_36 TaxID=3391666 RepID=UPI0039A6FE03